MNKYFIDKDNDCHSYLIPVYYREAWNKWLDSEDTDWVPIYATPLPFNYNQVEFEYDLSKLQGKL